jgi:hypothetical protein
MLGSDNDRSCHRDGTTNIRLRGLMDGRVVGSSRERELRAEFAAL